MTGKPACQWDQTPLCDEKPAQCLVYIPQFDGEPGHLGSGAKIRFMPQRVHHPASWLRSRRWRLEVLLGRGTRVT
jgi:hypothetical protein